jgi:hypothetical protein
MAHTKKQKGDAMSANMNALYRRRLVNPRVKEGIREPLYDFLSYNSGADTTLRFFQDPESGSKTKSDTNMTLNGQLPGGHKYVAETMEIHILPGSSASSYVIQPPVKTGTALAAPNFANDVWALVSTGFLKFHIGDKDYLTAPLLCFPPTTGLGITPAVAVENTNTTVLNQITVDYARLVGRVYVLNPIIPIEALTNFDVTLTWPAAVTLPSGFDARIGVVMNGLRFRN